jgi:4-amino-4-deoxy-L-arabinose transferase-like glycosyltransferase
MQSRVRVRVGRILLVTVGLTLLLNAFHVIELPWGFLWPLVLLLGGIAMIRWVTKPTPEATRARQSQAGRPAGGENLALRVARVLIGIFMKA